MVAFLPLLFPLPGPPTKTIACLSCEVVERRLAIKALISDSDLTISHIFIYIYI